MDCGSRSSHGSGLPVACRPPSTFHAMAASSFYLRDAVFIDVGRICPGPKHGVSSEPSPANSDRGLCAFVSFDAPGLAPDAIRLHLPLRLASPPPPCALYPLHQSTPPT